MASPPTVQPSARATKTIPIVEVFGPTIQGEGALAGLPTYFVRFGLCDFRCDWCDSLHAVLPEEVKANADYLTEPEIVDRVLALDRGPQWVTLSGGNPAVHDLAALVTQLQEHAGMKVTVETQGSIWRPWLADIDHLTVSPKPPSSGMINMKHANQLARFTKKAAEAMPSDRRSMKIVVFDADDLFWAETIFLTHGLGWDQYLSVGTDPPAARESLAKSRKKLADRSRWLYEEVSTRSSFAGVRVLPQLHVIAWGHARAV